MPAVVFGVEHFLYIAITTALAVAALILAQKYAKSDKAKTIFMKVLGFCLLDGLWRLFMRFVML